jgi:cysteine-rich repeat protein
VSARVLLAVFLLAGAARSWATTANDLCSPSANPCIVAQGRTVNVTDGSVINLGTRALLLASGSGTRLDAGLGSMTILAGSVTLNPGSALLARGGTIAVTTTGRIAILRSGNSRARIDVSDFVAPGTIMLDAGGDIEVQGILTAQGVGADGGSGSINIASGEDVVLSGEVNAAAGGNAIGGDVGIQAMDGDVLQSGFIDAAGGISGGTIDVMAGGSITTVLVSAARLDAKADGAEGDGGTVDLTTTDGDIVVNIPISAQGTAGVDFAGSGGDVTITAVKGSVLMNGAVDQSGGVPDGDGGDFDGSAGLDFTQLAPIVALGRDQLGVGGAVDLFAERALRAGAIDVAGTCLNCAGGDVDLIAWCSVTLPNGVLLDASGSGGGVVMRSGGDMDIHGRVLAGIGTSILYRDPANPPNLTGSFFTPSPNVQVVSTLVPCGGPPAPSCGDGIRQTGEGCDDGDQVSCDGCSSTCQVERCGDGRLGCDAAGEVEACDDGNILACDGCAADCSRRDQTCGDGTTECGETCDTGSAIDCDAGACSAQCQVETCGNGRVECSEQCDDSGASETCSDQCVLLSPPGCGDGTEDPGEGCDDGNTDDCDGCSRLCQPEGCGNGITECDEDCDDFNDTPCDGCSGTCAEESCGNDVVDCGEECDLGEENGTPGSNCLACRFAPVCSTETPKACIPCSGVLECDPLGRCGGTDCLDGICTPDPIDCESDDPCEVRSCDMIDGCQVTLILGFDSVRCRLDDLTDVLTSEAVSDKARTKLGKLLAKAGGKVDDAEAALDAGKAKKVGKSLKTARGTIVRFGKKVVKLQPKQITDGEVGAALSERAGDALGRIEALNADVGS